MNKKTSLMVIGVQKITLVTKRVQNKNYVTIIGRFPFCFGQIADQSVFFFFYHVKN